MATSSAWRTLGSLIASRVTLMSSDSRSGAFTLTSRSSNSFFALACSCALAICGSAGRSTSISPRNSAFICWLTSGMNTTTTLSR